MNEKRRVDVLLGLALVVAFSPGLYDLGRHWLEAPWSRYSALFVFLVVWLAMRRDDPRPLPRAGITAIVVALGLQLLGAMAVMPQLARPAVVIAGIGFLWLRGLAPPSVALVALWIVAVPSTLSHWAGGDWIAPALFHAAVRIVNGLGLGVVAGTHSVLSGDAELVVDSIQGGLPVMVAMLGLGCYAALRLRLPPARAAALGLLFLAGGAAAKFLAILLGCVALAAGSAAGASFLLDSFSWMMPAAVIVSAVERRASGLHRSA